MAIEVIKSTDNYKVKQVKAFFADRKARYGSGLFVAEGAKLCEELLESDYEVSAVWYTDQNEMLARRVVREKKCDAVMMSENVSAKLCDTKTPQGIFAVARIKADSFGTMLSKKRVALLSSVQDPVNVGTIIRSAVAFGFDGIVACGDTADVFSPKTLRGTMGAVFRAAVCVCDSPTAAISEFKRAGYDCIASALCEGAAPLGETSASPPLLVAVGNESKGLSAAEVALCRPVIIPMRRNVNSLNASVAASIFMMHFGGGDDE